MNEENKSLEEVSLSNLSASSKQSKQKFFTGIPSSPGMARGRVSVIQPEKIIMQTEQIAEEKIPDEIKRLDTAIKDIIQEFVSVLKKVKADSKNVAAVLESNLMILTDASLVNAIKNRIESGSPVESAVIQEFDSQSHYLKNAKDQILKERAIEIEHIKERLLSSLRNKCIYYGSAKNAIVVAQSLNPTDVVNFKEAGALGFITEVGGISSHSSILARNYELPEVIGVKGAVKSIPERAIVIIDGYNGVVTVNPTKHSINVYIEKKNQEREHKKQLGKLVKLPSVTLDDKKITLNANIDFMEDVQAAILNGAEGAGLVRSENLIIAKKDIPGEDEQIKWYTSIADRMYPNQVTIRAFDVGSDKYSKGMPKHEDNPALGFRGIRFLLHRTDIFKTQVKALLKVSKNKKIRLMLPMIISFQEIHQSLELIKQCKEELRAENVSFDEDLPVGIMIETPAAALLADKFGQLVDFFSIGTNDLTQHTLAVDRTNEFVSSFYDSFHPAILNLIKITAEAAKKNNIPVSVCGELAGHAAATSLLIGLGINELSVSPPILLELKKRVRETKESESIKLVEELLQYTRREEVVERLEIAK